MKKSVTQQQLQMRGTSENKNGTMKQQTNSNPLLGLQIGNNNLQVNGQNPKFFKTAGTTTTPAQHNQQHEQKMSISLKKFFGHVPQYRNANQNHSLSAANEQIQNVQAKFWQELGKSDKSLMKTENNRQRPQTALPQQPISRAFSMPKFNNKMLQQQELNEQDVDFEGNITAAVHNLNTVVNFQRTVNVYRQPFQFLSHVGGKFTSIKSISTEQTNEMMSKDSFPTKLVPVALMNQYEQLQMFKKIDIDKNIHDQIQKLAKVPVVLRTETAVSSTPSGVLTVTKKQEIAAFTSKSTRNLQSATSGSRSVAAITSAKRLSSPLQQSQKRNIQTAQASRSIPQQEQQNNEKPAIPFSAKSQSTRLLSAKQGRIQSAKPELMRRLQEKNKLILEDMNQVDKDLGIQEDIGGDDDFYARAEKIKGMKGSATNYLGETRPKSCLSGKRPLSGKSVGAETFFKEFKKFTQLNALEIPYEELFDRNERTITATFAKFGDLGYYAPVQRIGSYMQFSAKLKIEHLTEIVSLQQTSTTVEKAEFEIPIQLSIIDELNPFQKKSKTGISTTFSAEEIRREPISLSLFPEYFEETDEFPTPQDSSDALFAAMINEMGGLTYNPESLGKSKYTYLDPETWPENIKKIVESSVARYNHYLESDIIKPDEIPKFRKSWMVNAFNLLPQYLLANEITSRQV